MTTAKMNLSCNKPLTACAGDTLTITCFTCGMPSSKEWAQKVQSRPTNPIKPYFPFLLHLQLPQGLNLKEDGTTYVCAFCHASLESQWRNYERQPSDIPPVNRKYNLYKFICAVCGVETYRKRVRTLPFQEFPFLANQRPAGSLTLGNNPLAVVCLDCSETLWAQSAEYDRWGLPIHKRRFNWLARPPPDPDSLEATVARLPSGETQLPRCPPTEPILKTKDVPMYESGGKHKIRSSKSESNSGSESSTAVRKASLTSQANASLEAIGVPSQPPVVTVAPMSAHSTTISTHKKEILSGPPNLTSQFSKYESISVPCVRTTQSSHPLFPRSPIFPPSSYGPFPWGTREGSVGEHYSYPSLDGLQSSSNSAWAWLPPPSPNLIQYQNFAPSSFSNRSYSINEPYYNSVHSYYPPSPESNSTAISATTNASAHYVPPFSTTSVTSASLQQTVQAPKSANAMSSSRHSISIPNAYDQEISPPLRRRSTSEIQSARHLRLELKKPNLKHSFAANKPSAEASCGTQVPKTPVAVSSVHREVNFKSSTNITGSDSLPTNFKPKSNAIRNHINEKMMNSTQQKVSPNRIYIPNPSGSSHRRTTEDSLPKKWHWQSPEIKHNMHSKGRSISDSEPMDCSVTSQEPVCVSSPDSIPPQVDIARERVNSPCNASDTVIDLSLPTVHKNSYNVISNSNSYGTCKNKFMIAYLCQSESVSPPPQGPELVSPRHDFSESMDTGLEAIRTSPIPASGRRSVIFAATKVDSSEQLLPFRSDVISNKPAQSENDCSHCGIDTFDQEKIGERNYECKCDKNSENSQSGQNKRSTCCYPVQCLEKNSETMDKNSEDASSNSDSDSKCFQGEIAHEYVKQVISELKNEERQARRSKRKWEEDQEEFLESLGLVTVRKKSEHELNILIKRSNHHTLPPLKLRPSTPPKMQLQDDLKNKILQIAFDDPSLKKCDLSENEVAFLAQLDLKPATKLEKNNREVQWRFILTERMMREKRGASLCGAKKLWTGLATSKFQLPAKILRNNPSLLGSLSVTLPTFSNECTTDNESSRSSDLLRIAETHSGSSDPEKSTKIETVTVSGTCVMQPVISYPKYIPSYVSQASGSTNVSKVENSDVNASCPSSGPVSSRSGSPETNSKSFVASNATEDSAETKYPPLSNEKSGEDSRILKVPLINLNIDPLTSAGKESDQNKFPAELIDETPRSHPPSIIEDIIDADALNCENFVNQINNLLNSFPTTSKYLVKGEGQVLLPHSESEWKKLKKYLKSRQSQVKVIEDKLKKREKQILNQLRSCSNNTH